MALAQLNVSSEGLDGSGKSTLSEALAKHYANLGLAVVTLRSPSRTPRGLELRSRLFELTGVEKDRAFIDDLVASQADIPEGTDLAVWDRHLDSVHTSNADSSLSRVREIASGAGLVLPEVTFYLRMPLAAAIERAAPITDHPLDPDWMQMKLDRYEGLIGAPRIHVIDATMPEADVLQAAIGVVDARLA
jgi:thymidylate kinase